MKGVGRSWLGANLTAVLVLTVAISGCANQAPRDWGACGAGGAALGAIAGAGAGLGLEYNNKSHPTTANAAAAAGGGALIGAVIGLVAGHELCDPLVPPPPPAPQTITAPMSVAAPVTAPPAAPARTRIVLRGVHFDFNKYNIRPDDEPVLDEAVESLKEHPDVTVNVNGYCDAVGSVGYNLRLSRERAAAVVQYLSEHGVAASRLVAHGYGKTNFVASNDTAEGRAQNRRDELVPTD
jgi:outer membrane protein OmpA-like peptidoglycan-associated protein